MMKFLVLAISEMVGMKQFVHDYITVRKRSMENMIDHELVVVEINHFDFSSFVIYLDLIDLLIQLCSADHHFIEFV